ncbi:FK506-binding protein 15-like isoform X2 [Acipenser ruthenus]|uniref:FK506-binding protein 15-like isoform X2 n=1 Tax=Acipenser ruthenus TaxID=7906 RepID=UPI0027429C89|nr:FK506-binding protein 15-like isoform X2 [Acipenser ruthenus]
MSAVWDHDYLWHEIHGAKLASLFGLDKATAQGNESFQYTAPKQPKKGSGSAGPPSQKPAPPPGVPAVLLATAVHAYRYVNGQYTKQGKLGAAVLGSHTSREYKILLYASQQKQVTTARIHPGFLFTVQPSNYGTFYDDQRQNWSVMFESEKAAVDFCKEVCVAKGNSAPSLESVVTQDLVLGEGQAVESGDSLEVSYTGWLLQNHTIGQMFDSNVNKEKLLRLKLGAGKVIKGWEEGMVGMRKGGRRLLVVPPSLAYGAQGISNRIPGDSTLIFEAEIRRVKFVKDAGLDRLSLGSRDSAASSPAPSIESLGYELPGQPPASAAPLKPGYETQGGDPPTRAKSNSLNEQQAHNPDHTKAKLISRMARMGQPMLPFVTGALSSQPDSSDSEIEDPSVTRMRDQPPAVAPQPVHMAAHPVATQGLPFRPIVPQQLQSGLPASSVALLPVSMTTAHPQPIMPGSAHAFQPYSYPQSTASASQLQPVGQMYPAQPMPYQASGEVTSFLMTEARQHNTEIRLAVGKVADKVDQLASKVDDLQKQGGASLGLSSVSMETAMIMHNIQRIIQENERLKQDVFDKSSRLEEQNKKISELINQNQRYVEQSNQLMEQRNDSLKSTGEQTQARVLQAEQDKHALPLERGWDQVKVVEELSACTARVSQLQLQVSEHQKKEMELRTQLSAALQEAERQGSQTSTLQAQLAELREVSERAQSQYREEKQSRKQLQLRVSGLEEELGDLRTEKEGLEKTLADRKRKWALERQRCEEEAEELRRSSQQEMESVRAQLKRARSSTDQAAAEQLALLQAELEAEWQGKCDRSLAAAKEQHSRELAEVTEQRDSLQERVAQLQGKLSALKQSREAEEQRLLQHQEQGEELQALRGQYSALQQRAGLMKQQLEARVRELESREVEQPSTGGDEDTAGEVKRVMNGVFQSLRGEFDLQQSYTGKAVLAVIVNTIKTVTLQLLTQQQDSGRSESEEEQEEEEEEPEQEAAAQGNGLELEVHLEEEGLKQEVQEIKQEVKPEQVSKEGEAKREVQVKEEEKEEAGPQQEGQPKEEVESEEEPPQLPVPVLSSGGGLAEGQGADRLEEAQSEEGVTARESPGDEVAESGGKTAVSPPTGEPEQAASPLWQEGETKRASTPPSPLAVTQGPPRNPPPLPNLDECPGTEGGSAAPQTSRAGDPHSAPSPQQSKDRPRIPEGRGEGDEDLFRRAAPTKPPPPPEEEEDELSLKGRPPPAPLFGEDEDDDDLDWLG